MNRLSALLIFLCLLCAEQALAHSPYYTQSEQIQVNESESVTVKLLHGDGIIAGDPVRAIVVDSDLRVRAVSPLALKLHIVCHQQEGQRICAVYDSVSSLIYELDPESWAIGPVIEDQGRPLGTAYPEDMGQNFGFRQRPASYFEIMKYEGDKIKSYPILALVTLLWWTLIASLIVPPLYRICRNKGRIQSVTINTVVLALLRTGAAIALLFVTIVGWAWEPYSLYFAGFFALIGLFITLLLSHRWRGPSL